MFRHLTKRLKSTFPRRQSAQNAWPVPARCTFRHSESGLVVHGLHKSATMFLYRFFDELCEQLEIPLFSIHKPTPYRQRTPDTPAGAFVICPVRSFETDSPPVSTQQQVHRLFQVRDPRDVLVSEYFSIGWRHTTAGWSAEELQRRERIRSMSLDQYVIAEPEISKYPLLDRYQPLLKRMWDGEHDDLTTTVKYETMVTDFPDWLRPVLQTLQIDCDNTANESLRRFITSKYKHEFVADESDSGHRRNVKPGDHQEKLALETIAKLNQRFEPVLTTFSYRY